MVGIAKTTMESAVAEALSSGVAWNDLGPIKAEARKLSWNKSSWSRVVKEVSPDPLDAAFEKHYAITIAQTCRPAVAHITHADSSAQKVIYCR